MRLNFPIKLFATLGLTLVAAALLLAGRPAQAQAIAPINYHEPIVAVRGGVYFPINGRIASQVGRTLITGGVDITAAHQTYVSRTVVSVDYLDRTKNGHKLRMIPITVGQFTYLPGSNDFRPYYGFGIGIYLINQDIVSSDGVDQSKNDTGYGAYLGLGSDIGQNFFVEGRYHFVTPVNSTSASGPELNVGVRF